MASLMSVRIQQHDLNRNNKVNLQVVLHLKPSVFEIFPDINKKDLHLFGFPTSGVCENVQRYSFKSL
jgi:hypothetical protein